MPGRQPLGEGANLLEDTGGEVATGVGDGGEVDHAVGREGVTPAFHVHAEEESAGGCADGDGQVHGAGVVADGEAGGAHEGGQLVDVGRWSELGAGGGGDDGAGELFLAGAPGDDGGTPGDE